jgi:PAS domain S-box-containing protein
MAESVRRRADAPRPPAESRLTTALVEAPIGVVLTDPDGRILEVNDAYLRMLGYSATELNLHDSSGFTHPEDIPPSKAFFVRLIEGSRSATLEKRYFRKDGSVVWVRVSATMRRDEQGNPLDVIAVIEDISDRKALELRKAFLTRLDDESQVLADPLDVARTAARLLGDYLDVSRCAYADVEADEDSVNVIGDYNRDAESIGVTSTLGHYRFSAFGSQFLRAMRAGETFLLSDAETDARIGTALEAYRSTGIRASICVPLRMQGHLVAGLAVHDSQVRHWTSAEVDLVVSVARRCRESIERARVARELIEREQRFRFLAESIPQMVWTATPDGMLDYVNVQGVDYFGCPQKELLGAGWLSQVHPEDMDRTVDRWKHSLSTGEDYETSFRLRRGRDATWRLHLVRARPLKDHPGDIVQWFGTCTDVEDQHRATRQIEEDRQRWRELLHQAPAAIAILRGPDHKFEWVNDDYLHLVGRPAQAILGRPLIDALPEVGAQEYIGILNRVYQTGEPFMGHEALVHLNTGDGTPARQVYLNFVYLPKRDLSGRIDGIFVHATDVTDLVLGRKSVEERERQFRTLAESIPQMVWTADENGNLVWYNQRWYDFTGTTFEEMQGWGWQKVHDPKVLPEVITNWKKAISTGTPFEMIFPLKGADGEFRTFLTLVKPVKDSEGNVLRWIGSNTDVTDQRRTEEELRRVNRELEEFAYVASHDLQEPLRMVNIYTHLILNQLGQNTDLQQFGTFVRQGVKRMETLIHDLLTYSQAVHSEKGPPGDADLQAALAEAKSVLEGRIGQYAAVIISSPLPMVRGDTAQLGHVFQNLLSNALKYRKKNVPPRISITSVNEGDRVVVAVQDNGIGFEQQYAERIFGLFKRLHKDEVSGTGLGLAICQRVIERYDGKIWAEGRPGEGSTFFFSLPKAGD